MYGQLWTASCVHINPHHIELKCIACAFLDKSLTVVPVIYSGLYISLYFSYILLRLVKHPLPFPFTTLHTICISGFKVMFYRHIHVLLFVLLTRLPSAI